MHVRIFHAINCTYIILQLSFLFAWRAKKVFYWLFHVKSCHLPIHYKGHCKNYLTRLYPCHILSISPVFLQHQSVIPCSLHLVTPVNSCPTHMLPLNPHLRSSPYHHPPLSLFAPTLILSTSPTLPFLHLPVSHSSSSSVV